MQISKTYICFKETHINNRLFAILNTTSEHMWRFKMKYSDTIFAYGPNIYLGNTKFRFMRYFAFRKTLFQHWNFSKIKYFIDNGTHQRIENLNKIIISPQKLFNRLLLSRKTLQFFRHHMRCEFKTPKKLASIQTKNNIIKLTIHSNNSCKNSLIGNSMGEFLMNFQRQYVDTNSTCP